MSFPITFHFFSYKKEIPGNSRLYPCLCSPNKEPDFPQGKSEMQLLIDLLAEEREARRVERQELEDLKAQVGSIMGQKTSKKLNKGNKVVNHEGNIYRSKSAPKGDVSGNTLKDPFEQTDLEATLNLISNKYKTKPQIRARYRVALTLLYLLGLRVNELRQIRLGQIKRYLEGNSLLIAIGKSKVRAKYPFAASQGTITFLKYYCGKDLDCLFENDLNNALVPTSREHLTRELNALIVEHGKSVQKKLVSHSCRVSFITRICKTSGIETARAMVGHANISTTQIYNRHYLSANEQAKVLDDSLGVSSFVTTDLDSSLDFKQLFSED